MFFLQVRTFGRQESSNQTRPAAGAGKDGSVVSGTYFSVMRTRDRIPAPRELIPPSVLFGHTSAYIHAHTQIKSGGGGRGLKGGSAGHTKSLTRYWGWGVSLKYLFSVFSLFPVDLGSAAYGGSLLGCLSCLCHTPLLKLPESIQYAVNS